MTQDEIREYIGAHEGVRVQIASEGDGSPEIAWGDTFFYTRGADGEPAKMPFTTIVTKDYDGFDCESKLNRRGLFRLNIEVGKSKFEELFGFAPKDSDSNRAKFDVTSSNSLFPHPTYGRNGWVSIINPEDATRTEVLALLDLSLNRHARRASA